MISWYKAKISSYPVDLLWQHLALFSQISLYIFLVLLGSTSYTQDCVRVLWLRVTQKFHSTGHCVPHSTMIWLNSYLPLPLLDFLSSHVARLHTAKRPQLWNKRYEPQCQMCKFKDLCCYLSQPIPVHKKNQFLDQLCSWGGKSIMVLANDSITLWMLGSLLHVPHCMLTLAVLNCISIMLLSRFNIKLPFTITSLLNILRFSLVVIPPSPNNYECMKWLAQRVQAPLMPSESCHPILISLGAELQQSLSLDFWFHYSSRSSLCYHFLVSFPPCFCFWGDFLCFWGDF